MPGWIQLTRIGGTLTPWWVQTRLITHLGRSTLGAATLVAFPGDDNWIEVAETPELIMQLIRDAL